jgi:DNA-binding CsgD family transcriptional regulator
MQAETIDIARLLPELQADLSLTLPPDDDQSRFRLFESLTTFFTRVARRQPLVLILDDLHWADTPSLLLLQFLAHELSRSYVLVIATYRDVEVNRDHPLAKTIAQLGRLRGSLFIALGGLAVAEVAHFVEQTTGQAPPPALLTTVMAETAGNPFFITELIQLLVRSDTGASGSRALPPTVRGAIRQRLNLLSSESNTILNIAAVIGREFSLTILRRLSSLTQSELLTSLDEAINARLIMLTPESMGHYHFVHALVRETLYEELPSVQRVRYHQQVGEALEEVYQGNPDAHLTELAHHFNQAAVGNQVDKAIDYARRTAAWNMQLLAYEEAARYYERTLDLLEQQEGQDLRQQCTLLLALGQAQASSGQTTQARATFEHAAPLARHLNSAEHLTQAALGFAGGVVTPGMVNQRAVTLLTEALAALPQADHHLRVRLLSRLAMEHLFSPLREQREILSSEAVAIARRLGDRSTLVFALYARHYAILAPDTLEQRVAVSTELAQLAQDTGDWEVALRSLPWRWADLLDLGQVQAADETVEQSARLAQELRQPLYVWYIGVYRALRALMQGEFNQGERLAQAAHALGQRVQPGGAAVYFAAQLFVLRREQARLAEVEKPLLDIMIQYPAMPVIRCMLIQVYWQSGRFSEAQAELTALCANKVAALPWDQLWLGAIVTLAETAVLLADRPCAASLYELLLPYAQRNVIVGVPICLGSAATYLGCLATLLEHWPAAEQHFEEALAFNTRLGAKPFVAWTQYHYGMMLRQRNQATDHQRANDLLQQAQTMAQELGMAYLTGQIQRLEAEPSPQPSPPIYPDGLTPREVEVLGLIAAGKSTKEIAAALVISVATVERHITHIYEKIGAGSRAEATAYALRQGLG